MLLVAWICLMWAQFYTESFAFVSMGSMYRLATTDTDPSSIHSPVYFAARHCLCSGPCHASRCCQGCIAVEYILQRRQCAQHIRSISGALTMENICNLSSPWRTAASIIMLLLTSCLGCMGAEASTAATQKILTYSKTDSLRYQLYVSTIWFPLTLDIGEPTLRGHMGLTPGEFYGLSEANPSMWQTSNQKWTSVAKSWDTICTFSARHGTVLGLGAKAPKLNGCASAARSLLH